MDLFGFFYMHPSGLTSTICWRYYLYPSVYFWVPYEVSGVCGFMSGSLIHVIDHCFCSCAAAVLFYYYSYVMGFKARDSDAFHSSFIIQDYISSLILFCLFPHEAENCSVKICVKLCWNFEGGCIKSLDCF